MGRGGEGRGSPGEAREERGLRVGNGVGREPQWESCWGSGLWGGWEGLDSQRNLLAQSQPPSAAAKAFSPRPAKGGVWPARGAGGGQAGEIPSISPPAAGNGFQEFGRGGTRLARCNPFVGLSEEIEPGEGLTASGTDLGLETLQERHLQWFAVKH